MGLGVVGASLTDPACHSFWMPCALTPCDASHLSIFGSFAMQLGPQPRPCAMVVLASPVMRATARGWGGALELG